MTLRITLQNTGLGVVAQLTRVPNTETDRPSYTCDMSSKLGGLKLHEWTISEDMSGVDFAGVDSDGGYHRRWTMTEWISLS